MSKSSVLIVDDHEAIRRTLRLRLEAIPEFTVCGEAVNGLDAIEKAQRFSPNLVILDFAMPEMNGLEAAVALKCIMPSVRLYLLSAHRSRELELAARDAGIDAVFSKYDNLTALFQRARLDSVLKEAHDTQSSPTNTAQPPSIPSDGKTNTH